MKHFIIILALIFAPSGVAIAGNGPPFGDSTSSADARQSVRVDATGRSKATGGAATGGSAEAHTGDVDSRIKIEGDEYGPTIYEDNPPAAAPPATYSTSACNTSGAAIQGNGGGVSVAIPSYACDVAEIHLALDSLEGRGFFGGTIPGFFLNAQLFTKGLFKTIYPF